MMDGQTRVTEGDGCNRRWRTGGKTDWAKFPKNNKGTGEVISQAKSKIILFEQKKWDFSQDN